MDEPTLKQYDGKTLEACDGLEGKPACVAVDGVVYDVSSSKLWKNGLHMKRHRAGRDLSADIAAAPHGKEVLEKVARVGELKRDASDERPVPVFLARLLETVPFLRRHPHPMVVHFPIAFTYASVFFSVLYLITGVKSMEVTAFHCMAAGILFIPPAMFTGWFSWWLNYAGRPMKPVTTKKRCSWLLLGLSLVLFAWRFCTADILDTSGAGRGVYIAMLLLLVPLVSVIGYLGGQMTFPTGHEKNPR